MRLCASLVLLLSWYYSQPCRRLTLADSYWLVSPRSSLSGLLRLLISFVSAPPKSPIQTNFLEFWRVPANSPPLLFPFGAFMRRNAQGPGALSAIMHRTCAAWRIRSNVFNFAIYFLTCLLRSIPSFPSYFGYSPVSKSQNGPSFCDNLRRRLVIFTNSFPNLQNLAEPLIHVGCHPIPSNTFPSLAIPCHPFQPYRVGRIP